MTGSAARGRLGGVCLVLTACLAVAAWCAARRAEGGEPPDNGRYERQVRPGAPGPNRLPVDLPLLIGAQPFTLVSRMSGVGETVAVAQGGAGDLRFYDEEGREVPYLLVQPPPRTAEWRAGRVLPVAASKKASGFEVDLGTNQAVDCLALSGLPAPYLKRARLEGSGDRRRWTLLVDETTVFDLPDERLTRPEIEFAAGEFRYLRVTWDDTNSARLPLPRAVRARVVAPGAPHAALRTPLAFERRASEPGLSRYRVTLPAPHLPVVAVELSVGSGYVLRQARVVESRLTGAEMKPVVLGTAMLRRAVRDDLAAAALTVPLAPPQESQLELVVEDGNNAPLDLTGISAVFAELPWIYFEAPSTHLLVARFGGPSPGAPRYDLEAVRPTLGRTPMADAAWGEALDLVPAAGPVSAAGAMPVVGAALDAAAFAHRRAIPPSPRGLTALRLDPAALAHSRMADLRVATADDRQVAYLVEHLDEPLAIELPAARPQRDARANAPLLDAAGRTTGARTVYRVDLPFAGLPASRLVLATPARVFARTVRVLAAQADADTRDARQFRVVAESGWEHADPGTPAGPLTLPLPAALPESIWLVVDEGDNSPLPLARARLLLPAYRLRFFHDSTTPLWLLYGNPSASAPRYDLALLAPRLVGAAAHEVWPASEDAGRQTPSARFAFTATRVFWGALVAAVLVLLVLLVRLVRT